MNTELLKQKILDLAIRGKLSQQLKSDGTAADLLKEICDRTQEKTSLRAKRGNPSPQTIIPLDKNEAPFEIPANWEWVRLGDVCDISSAKRVLKEDWKDSGIPFYRAREIAQLANGEKVKDDLFITKELYESLKRQYGVPQPGDILMSAVGTIGKTYIVQKNDCFYYKDASVICLKIRSLNISPTFLKILLASDFLQKQMYANSSGTTVDTITISVAQEYFFPLPPFAEQQRIVEKIQEAFAEIDSIKNNKELLKTHIKQTRQKILDLAIHGKLVPQNKTDEPASVLLERITRDNPHYEKLTDVPFEIPDSWEWVKLGDVAALKGGKRVPAGKTMTTEPTSHIYIRVTDMRDGTIYDDDLHYITDEIYEVIKNYTISKKDLYITIAGTIGRVGLVPDFFDGMNLTENALKVTEITIEKKYLMFVLQSRFVQEYFESTYHQVAMPKLSLVNASKAVIPLPPLAEQKRIVDRIEEIFASLNDISLHLV